MQEHHIITPAEKSAIESVLAKGDRVELIPTKDGIHILRVSREKIEALLGKDINVTRKQTK